MNYMKSGEIIKKRRIELGLTAKEVAKRVGVAESTVVRWETGYIGSMKIDTAKNVANALHLSPLVFITENLDFSESNLSIGEIIRNRRLELNLTLEEVSRRTGVTNATISRWETGEIRSMRLTVAVKLANALHISLLTLAKSCQ